MPGGLMSISRVNEAMKSASQHENFLFCFVSFCLSDSVITLICTSILMSFSSPCRNDVAFWACSAHAFDSSAIQVHTMLFMIILH
jgi:hypothetical protein